MVQELTGDSASEQWMQEFGNDENAGDGDDKARTELQTLFNALKKAEAKMQVMDDASAEDTANSEKIKKWWKGVKRRFGSKIRKSVRKYLC